MGPADIEDRHVSTLIEALAAKLMANKQLVGHVIAGRGKGAIIIKAYPRGSGYDVQVNITV